MSSLPERAEMGRNVYLHPGQLAVLSDPALVTTILGSCVAVCLWDPTIRVGAINHFLLPKNPARSGDDLRYGDTAMERLIAAMWQRAAIVPRVEAKVFGGGCVLKNFENNSRSIGAQNVEAARRFLERRGIEIVAEQTGGDRGLKLVFDTGSGAAWVKEL
jgi:chemotaxis protein CheD